MKRFIAFCIFAIGLMISLPSTASRSGSESPPGQVSFVSEQPAIAPAMAYAFVPQTTNFVVYNQLAPITVVVKEEGGLAIEKSLNTSLDLGYLNKDVVMSKVPTYKLNCDFGFLLCLYTKEMINQNTTAKNIQSDGPITIRADSQV